MDSPAHFSVPAGDESLLWNQAPPSAASSSRYYDESQDLQPENEGDRTVRLQQVQLAQDSSAMNSQRQDDTFAFKGTMGSAPDPETPVVHSTSPSSNEDEHVTRLRTERDRLRGMNDSLERTILHFEGARSQLDRLQSNISTTQGLMRLWSELMSQTEHTRGLVMDTGWTMDGDLDFLQAEQEREERERQAEQSEKERILREAQEEEERRKAEAAAAQEAQKSRGTRGSAGSRIRPRGTSSRSIPTPISSTSGIPSRGTSANATGRGSAPVTGVRGVRGLRSRGSSTASGRGRGTT